MPPVDIAPMMDHPGWKTMTPDQRKQALALWQDPETSDDDRVQMGQIMDRWATASAPAAQAPAPPQPAPGRVDLQGLQADPEFQRLPSQEQQQLLQHAQRQQPTATEAPQATPVSGTVNLDTLKADPEFQALSAQEQAQLLQHAQRSSGAPPRAPQASTPAEEPITPERRFLDLPSSQQMSLEDRTRHFQEFYRLKPELKEEFLRSEEPPSDLVVDIEKPSPPAPTGWRANLPQTPEEWDRRMAPMKRTAEDTSANAIPMALSMLPGAIGYTLGAKLAPSLGAVGKVVPPLLEAAGGYAGHRANVALGNEKEGPLGDVLSVLPLVTRSLGTATAGWLERTISEAPVAARDATMDLLSKLFSRGGAQGTLTYLLSGDPQMAAWVGGSYATLRSLLGFALKRPDVKQLVETWLKAGRAIGGPELGMLLQMGRTGKASADGAGTARTVDIAPMMDHPHWKTLTPAQRQEALRLWQDKDTSPEDRAEMLKVMGDHSPAKESGLLPTPRLRTGRESFPSSGSSISKAR